MADQPANVAPDPRARIIQRCPNCEARADVSTFVAGALVRCARCGVRFQVQRPVSIERRKTPPPPAPVPAPPLPQAAQGPTPLHAHWPTTQPDAQGPTQQGPAPIWPETSEPRWDMLGLGDAKTLPSDPLGRKAMLPHAAPAIPGVQGAIPLVAPRAAGDARPPQAVLDAQRVADSRRFAELQKPAAPNPGAGNLAHLRPLPAPQVRPEPVPTQAQRAPPPPAPMPFLDGFSVHERLGQGGMGEVFRCSKRDGSTVAVKVLSQSLAVVPDYVKRFEREAAAMAQLDHPGIVRLLDRGRSGQHCWISMELIAGVSLRTYAHQNRPSSRMLAKLLSQVAHALAYAHARGVVHRDLKPDNVLVQADQKTKVLDFGLAGLYVQGAECLTQSNVAMGTANYMAPEQRKDAKHVDHRADLYSFGVMLYELLTGELPIGRFPAPSKVVPGLSSDWDQLVERCLELEPAKRPHSALELAHALEKLGGMSPSMDLAPRTKRKSAGRSGIWSWMGLGIFAVILAGVVTLKIAQEHLNHARTLTVPAMTLAGRATAAHPGHR